MLNIKQYFKVTYDISYIYEQDDTNMHSYIPAIVNSDDLVEFFKY